MNIPNLSNYLFECGKVIAENAFSPKHHYAFPKTCTSLNNLLEIEKRTCDELCEKHPHIQYAIENHIVKIPSVLSDKSVSLELGVYVLRFFPKYLHSPQEVNKHLLALHGINSGPLYFLNIVPPLVEDGYDVCCLSIPYFGGSQGSKYLLEMDCHQMMDVWVEYLAKSVDVLFGECRPHIYAHSYGAHISIKFAKKYSHLVDKIILNNVFGLFPLLGKYGYYLGVAMRLEYPTFFMKPLGRWWTAFMYYCVDARLPLINKQYWDYTVGACHELKGFALFNKHIDVDFRQATICDYSIFDLLEIADNEIVLIWSDDDFVTPLHNGLMACYVYRRLLGGGGANTRFYLLRGGDHNPVSLNEGKNVFTALRHCLSGAGEAGATAIDIDKQYKDEGAPDPDPTQQSPHIQTFTDKMKYMYDICYGYTSVDMTAQTINTMYDKTFDCLNSLSPQNDSLLDVYVVDDDANIIPKSIDIKDYVYE